MVNHFKYICDYVKCVCKPIESSTQQKKKIKRKKRNANPFRFQTQQLSGCNTSTETTSRPDERRREREKKSPVLYWVSVCVYVVCCEIQTKCANSAHCHGDKKVMKQISPEECIMYIPHAQENDCWSFKFVAFSRSSNEIKYEIENTSHINSRKVSEFKKKKKIHMKIIRVFPYKHPHTHTAY